MIRRNKKNLPDPARFIRKSEYPSARQCDTVSLSRDASRAGPLTLKLWRIKRHTEGAFLCLSSTMAAGVGTIRGGRTHSPVLATRTSPPPKPLTEVADSLNAMESNP